MSIKEKIGKRITEMRKSMGITIKELAAATKNLSAARISNWEQGTRSPGPEEIKLVAQVLNVSASYLLCLTDNPEGDWQPSKSKILVAPLFSLEEVSQAKEKLINYEDKPNFFDVAKNTILIDKHDKAFSSLSLFGAIIEDASMQPEFNIGDIVILDSEHIACPGDYVLVYLTEKKQAIIRRYAEIESSLFQLQAINPLWASITVNCKEDALVVGTVVEHRRYF